MDPTLICRALARAAKTSFFAALVFAPACRPHLFGPTTIVPTATPGVAYVIVDPWLGSTGSKKSTFTQGDGLVIDADEAQYILLCDARPVDGMHCELVKEVAKQRESYTATVPRASASVDAAIGSSGAAVVEVSGAIVAPAPSTSSSTGGAP